MIEHLQKIGPSSIRGLARSVERDVKRVHEDVSALSDRGIFEQTDDGKVHVPTKSSTRISTSERQPDQGPQRKPSPGQYDRGPQDVDGEGFRRRRAFAHAVGLFQGDRLVTSYEMSASAQRVAAKPSSRGMIDRNRRLTAHRPVPATRLGFLRPLKQSGETLAGHIAYLEMQPVDGLEVPANAMDKLWLIG